MERRRSVADEEEPRTVAPAGAAHEEGLLRRAARGELRAFEELFRIYHPRLARFVGRIVRSPELVEEVVDDTLLAVWRRADSYNGASQVSTWIFAIAYRKALKAFRRLDEPMEDRTEDIRADDQPGPEQALGRVQARAALLGAMEHLSPEHRAVVHLTYFHGIGYREIAEILACPVDTVKTRMFHARRRLKAALPGELAEWL
jgi:RNA polymerase sigma-70 factor (ECF subfamily)